MSDDARGDRGVFARVGEAVVAAARWQARFVARERVRLLLVLLGCVLETLATPPWPAPALVFVQDVPFLLLLWDRGGERWKRWAYAYGFARYAVGLRWLVEVHWSMAVAAAAILALTQWGWGGAIRWLVRRRVPYLPAVAVTAALQEIAQTVIQGTSGMPWPARALAFVAWPHFLGAASMFGAYGLSALAAATSAWASGLPGLMRQDGWQFERVRGLLGTGLGLGMLAAVFAWSGLLHESEVNGRLEGPGAKAIKTKPLVIVQGNIPQSLKNEHEDPDAANKIFDAHLRLTTESLEKLLDERTDALAVMWPETMIPWPFHSKELATRFPELPEGGSFRNQHTVLASIRDAVPKGATTLFLLGVNHYFRGRTGDHDHPLDYDEHDSLVAVDVSQVPAEPPDPSAWPASGLWEWEIPPGRHDKVKLVPWGEFTPGGSWIPGLRTVRGWISVIPEITPGDPDREPFLLSLAPAEKPGGDARQVLAGTVICFEIAFPARCRAWRDRGATVLLNAGNYGWYGDTDMPAQIEAIGRLRAAELAVTVVIAGNTGPSSIIDPSGAVRTKLRRDGRTQFVEGWCAGPLWSDPGYRTLYSRWGDVPWFLAGATLILVALLRRRSSGLDRSPISAAPAAPPTVPDRPEAPRGPSGGLPLPGSTDTTPSGPPG